MVSRYNAPRLKRAPRPAQTRLIEGLERLGADDLAGLSRGLERLVAAMGVGGDRADMFFEEEAEPRSER